MADYQTGKTLLKKYLKGTATDAERDVVDHWYTEQLFKNLQKQEEEDYDLVKTEIWSAIDNGHHKPVRKLLPLLSSIAATVAIISFGVWMYHQSASNTALTGGKHQDQRVYTNDIGPGKNVATLTLSNGKIIQLSEDKTGVVIGNDLKYDDNTLAASLEQTGLSDSKITQLTASTPRGGTYVISLPDGTKVWLNAASTLTFASNLGKAGVRSVDLNGEGYFEVSHDETRPFKVRSGRQEVTVLGTHFNVRAYPEDKGIKTTLLQGTVSVNNTLLKPGQQSLFVDNNLSITTVDTEIATSWKNGEFIFDGQDFKTIMNDLSRWYDVDIYYDPALSNLHFGGQISRSRNLSGVLKMLEVTGDVKIKIEGRRISVIR